MAASWLIVGLGNPGPKYALTRHNAGHMVIDELAARAAVTLKRHRAGAQVATLTLGTVPGPRALIATLDCYMNVSGGPVRALADYFGIAPDGGLVVVHDDLDLDAHVIRLKRGGGEGGHNGLRSISQHLGTRDYARVRVGVGRPPGRQDPADYVLAPIASSAREDWLVTVRRAADAVEDLVTVGLVAAQQKWHSAN